MRPVFLKALGVTVLLSVLGLSSAFASIYPNRPKILLHIRPVTTKTACTTWPQLTDCTNAVVTSDLAPTTGAFVYLIVAKGDSMPDVAGFEFGITYNTGMMDGVGIDIFAWTLCATLEFQQPTPVWPSPGAGNLITWDSVNACQSGAVAVAGYFYVAAYSADVLRITPRPVSGNAKIASCDANETGPLALYDLGSASFSPGATVAGCNPCNTPCASVPGGLVCSAGAYPTSGSPPLTVYFTGGAASGTPPYSYSWNFGDGYTSTLQNPSHTYSSPGSYHPLITVYDSSAPVQTCTQSASTIYVNAPTLSCSGSATPTSGTAPLTVNFTGGATSGTAPYTYNWTFGDGGTSTQQNPTHVYTSSGYFYPTLIVRDSSSPVQSCTRNLTSIYVSPPPYTVLSPNGGETWVAGSSVSIQWYANYYSSDIYLSYDAGATWTKVLSSVGTSGANQLAMIVPAVETSSALLRASEAGYTPSGSNSDVSDGVFRIVVPGVPPSAAVVLHSTTSNDAAFDQAGFSVAGIGDMNGDGFADYASGTPYSADAGADAGQVTVFLGGPASDSQPDLVLNGAAGDLLGFSVAAAGDVNGDGYADLIAGAPWNDAGGADAGRAFIYLGGPAPDGIPDLTLTGEAASDYFGSAVAGGFDINNDGYADFIVGASAYGALNPGRAYVFLGGPAMDATPDLTLAGSGAETFGSSVAGAGDMNGDGFDDVAVGAPFNSESFTNAGKVYVFLGGAVLNGVADLAVSGPAANDELGRSLAGVGDVNGDAFDDLLVGAPAKNSGGGAGRAFLYQGDAVLHPTASLVLAGAGADDVFGRSVAAAGDVNGDGYADMAVGAPYSDAAGTDAGRVYVYFGNSALDGLADFVLSGSSNQENFGWAVSGAGDVLGDAFTDVVVGSAGADQPDEDAGKVSLYDFNRFHLLSPIGAEVWNVGSTRSITWLGSELADLLLSVDGGRSFERLRSRVGGHGTNTVPLVVPHSPTRFAQIQVLPSNAALTGSDQTDSLFTIQASISLLMLKAEPAEGGTIISWSTDPPVGPAGIAGYRLYGKDPGASNEARVGPDLITESHYLDDGPSGRTYRLTGVNGLSEEIELGRIAAVAPWVGLRAWPSPARIGSRVHIVLSAPGLSVEAIRKGVEIGIFDVRGRRIATPVPDDGTADGGEAISFSWDGGTIEGGAAASGIYFIRASSGASVVQLSAKQRIVLVK